ncbi:MAG: flagellar motor protein MotB [Alphaproteobacteria bacterium]|nr:flagellar motor protein MotB [Alphaproteobacteria bacterium]
MADQPVIIIRRKKKGGHAGHHGGAWKVAYADFVTAMMSFFLLLWLLNVTTSEQRKGLADYFAPASISKSDSGAGGVFGGESITSVSGGEISDRSPPSAQNTTIPTAGQGEEGDEDTKGLSKEAGAGKTDAQGNAAKAAQPMNAQEVAEAMKSEEESFKQAEQILKQAIASNPELQNFANQIVIDRTPEGLRIQITDRDKFSMFPSASADPYGRARELLILVGKVIAMLPNKIAITGHTDSALFSLWSGHNNWELSAERADVSREYLVKAGVAATRIVRISGVADRDPFVPDPKDPRNRRISIVLLRQTLPPPPEAAPNLAAAEK